MEKRICVLFLLFLVSGVLAAGNVSDDSLNMSDVEGSVLEDGKFFTVNFYIFLVIAIVGLVVLAIFIWLWIRGPKNKWE